MRSIVRIPFATIVALLAPLGPLAAQEKKPAEWSPMQMMQVKRVSGVQVSPEIGRAHV